MQLVVFTVHVAHLGPVIPHDNSIVLYYVKTGAKTMFRKCLVFLLIAAHVTACSGIKTVLPTPTMVPIPIPTKGEKTVTQSLVIASSSRVLTLTPTDDITSLPTTNATATVPARSCPDTWFDDPQHSTPPIFLMMFSALYAAYRYDASPDKPIFELRYIPTGGFAASFSQNQQLIAYHIQNERSSATELWLSDVTLCNPLIVYTDKGRQMSEPNSFTYFQWGPGDKTLIYRSSENEFPMLIYHLVDQSVEFWQGSCEDILYLEETHEVAVGCSHDGKYSYLHMDGRVTTATSIPKPTGDPVVAWSFSKEGDAAYITADAEVYLLQRSGQKIKLPLKGFSSIVSPWDPIPLQWSTNQNRLLVLSYDPQEKRCPAEKACWFVIDGDNGEITWWLKPEAIKKKVQWDEVDTMHPAALSPDGELLALQYYWVPIKTLMIVRLSDNDVLSEADIFSDQMVWPAR